jgi:hypothetical protein
VLIQREDNPNQSNRQRSLAQRRCFGCQEKGHKIEACINRAKVPSWKPGCTGFAKLVAPVSTEKPQVKLNKGFLKAQEKFRDKNGSVTSVKGNGNIKHKIFYTCRPKGHLGKDCPNSKNPKLNHVHYSNEKLRSDSNDSSAPKVVISQSKDMITNIVGPSARWVPKHA